MNENWLDSYCEHHTYSIMVREPVARTKSHLNYFLDAIAWRDGHLDDTKNWRLSLIQSNYMTWALSAAHEIESNRTKLYYPSDTHLKVAMERLMEMDYLVDFSHADETCRNDFLLRRSLKINNPIMHENAAGYDYATDFPRQYTEATNEHDIELYRLATKIIDHDCHFLDRVFN